MDLFISLVNAQLKKQIVKVVIILKFVEINRKI